MIHGEASRPCRPRSACRGHGFRAAPWLSSRLHPHVGRRTPAQQPPLERVDAPVAEKHDAGRRRERDEDAGRVEVHRAELHQIAEPAIGRDQLGDHRAADRIRHGDAQAGEDVRHRAREHDVAGKLPLGRADHLGHLHQPGVERAHAGLRAEIHDEEHRDGDERDLRLDPDAEPENEQRRERELRRAVAADHERIEDRGENRPAAQRERQRRRRQRADQEPDDRLAQRVGRRGATGRRSRCPPRSASARPTASRSSRCRTRGSAPARSRSAQAARAAGRRARAAPARAGSTMAQSFRSARFKLM